MKVERRRRPDAARAFRGRRVEVVTTQREWLRLHRWHAYQRFHAPPAISHAVASGSGPTRDDAIARCSAELDRLEYYADCIYHATDEQLEAVACGLNPFPNQGDPEWQL